MAIISTELITLRNAGLFLGILLVYAIFRRVFIRFFHLSNFAGPKLAGYTRYWLIKTYASKDSANIFLDANKHFGKLVRIGPNTLLTDDPEINWRVLGPHSNYRRGKWFDSLRFDPHYTKQMQLKAVDKTSSARSYDLARNVRMMTLEIAAWVCFSEGLGFGYEEEERDEFQKSIEENAPYAQYLSTIHGLFSLIYTICSIPGMKNRMVLTEHNNPGIGKIMKVSRIVTEKRYAPDAKPVNDMLGSWMKRGLTQHEAETETSIALVTGAFPSSAAINVVVLHVATNPLILSRLRNELDAAVAKGEISTPITNAQAMKLPYFQACVSEALRRFPPITQLRERVAPPGGDTLDGRYVPAGTQIGLNAWGLQRHPCFGDEPEVYRPERWLEADEKRLMEMNKVQALVFGYGGTKCLGVTQAMMIINKVLIELFRTFDIEVVNPMKPWVDQCNGVSFHQDFFVRLEKRVRG
ncbi:MAG: hypothetical protein Q9157_002956 [Trypethelium eluteriae]